MSSSPTKSPRSPKSYSKKDAAFRAENPHLFRTGKTPVKSPRTDIDYSGVMARVNLITENIRKASEKYNRVLPPVPAEPEVDIRNKISSILMNRILANPQIFRMK
jgi:hypothetical protein